MPYSDKQGAHLRALPPNVTFASGPTASRSSDWGPGWSWHPCDVAAVTRLRLIGRVLRAGEVVSGTGGWYGGDWVAGGRADLLFVEVGGVVCLGVECDGSEVDVTNTVGPGEDDGGEASQSFSGAATHARPDVCPDARHASRPVSRRTPSPLRGPSSGAPHTRSPRIAQSLGMA